MSVSIHDAIKFNRFLLLFQAVRREITIPNREETENDVEHSYQLAMMGWYLNDAGKWHLDVDKLIRYALVHDIVEAYAGDLHIFHPDRVNKGANEAAALVRIASELAEFPELIDTIHRYEAQADEESRYVYALDKLMPMIMVYIEGGTSWRRLGFEMEATIANKEERIAGSRHIYPLHQQLSRLIRERPELFDSEA